ncbi:MAG: MotA/TolQ/ExbB proton channel family protein [Desulfurellaceae bacterium]|nr:MotA/TolQ/ExbB proton channel family protein [Desulfurellaceae bacterium]
MTKTLSNIIALVVSVVAVHITYIGYIRPQASLVLEASRQAGQSAPRHLVVILKDYEQEICLILMLWGMFLILGKCLAILREQYLFSVDLLEEPAQEPEEAAEGEAAEDSPGEFHGLSSALKTLETLPPDIRETPLVKTLMTSLRRFLITQDVQNTSDAIESSVEALALKQDAENSMIRYLIWAIPSIGFIGTVRGIGQALSQADQALAGDIAGMTESLGIAFNSTLVALLISIALMFMLHQLQRLQDNLVVDTQDYCEAFLLNRISKGGDDAHPVKLESSPSLSVGRN